MLYSFIFFHTTIQVNDTEASISDMSNTINKKPCKNTTQAGTNHKILLNYYFLYKNPNIYYFFFYQKYIFILFSNLYNTKIWQEYSYTSIVQYSYIFLYEYCCHQVQMIRVLLLPSSNDSSIIRIEYSCHMLALY